MLVGNSSSLLSKSVREVMFLLSFDSYSSYSFYSSISENPVPLYYIREKLALPGYRRSAQEQIFLPSVYSELYLLQNVQYTVAPNDFVDM